MLQSLVINNFALIDKLEVDFKEGLSIITGETGAGKSIILGGLSLVLGKRADLSSLKNKDKKCIIEAHFLIANYNLNSFFEKHDLDYEDITIIRREILPSGKSRAFINDTPIILSILNELSEQLIDVHSQQQTLQLANNKFQFHIIDALAANKKRLESYVRGLKIYKTLQKQLAEIKETQALAKKEYDYDLHLLNELEKANFQQDEQENLEQKLDKLNNVELIQQNLASSLSLLNSEQSGIVDTLNSVNINWNTLRVFSKEYEAIYNRLESVKIELDDITNEIESHNENVIVNPLEIEKYNDRLQDMYDLQRKHEVATIKELQKIQQSLTNKIKNVENEHEILQIKENEITIVRKKLQSLSDAIHINRSKAIPNFVKKLEKSLAILEMPSVRFQLKLIKKDTFLYNGKEELVFLVSTNKGANFIPLKKGPSGGEMSRIMLAIKSILSNYIDLPTIIFDEIDTGVSGEVSNKIAKVMLEMSANMQVISITHLPQIAAQGKQHYKVFKKEKENEIVTNIKLLTPKERIQEIAEMLGGKKITESALSHAKQLLLN